MKLVKMSKAPGRKTQPSALKASDHWQNSGMEASRRFLGAYLRPD